MAPGCAPPTDEEVDKAAGPDLERAHEVLAGTAEAPRGYDRLTFTSGQVDVHTTLPPEPDSVGPAVKLCSAAVDVLDGGYRISVRAANGRQLAFRVHGRCRRMHLKATTTLWSLGLR